MSLISRVRCSRCDRSFSGLKNKCPYCDAYRGRSGKRAYDANDLFARRMIKVLLLVALVVTLLSVLLLNLDDADDLSGHAANTPPEQQTPGDQIELPPIPIPTPTPLPPPPPAIEVTSVQIAWQSWAPGVNDFTIGVGQTLEMWVNVFPVEADAPISWSIESNTIALITQDPDDHARITLEARGRGPTTLQVTVGDMTDTVTVRVN